MPFHPVIYRYPVIPPLDPTTLLLFVAAFAGAALLTMRRPAYAAMLLAVVPPFTFEHAVFGTTLSFPKMVLLGTLTGMIAYPSAFRRLADLRVVLIAFAFILAAILISGLTALYHAEVLREFFKWIEYALFFAVASIAFTIDPDTALVRRVFTISVVVVCATAFFDFVRGASSGLWINGIAIPRIAGVLEGPNQLAGYLEVAIAFLGAFSIDATRRTTNVVLALCGVTLVLTFSRASIAGVVAIVAVFFILRRRDSLRALAWLAPGVALGMAGIAAVLIRIKGASLSNIALRTSDVSPASSGGVGARSELWHAAWYFFSRHPIFGVGAGNYELRLNEAGLHGVRTHANSWYLQSLAEGGVILFAATVFFIIALLRQTFANARRSTWALAAVAATVALAIHQVADYLVFYPKVAESWLVLCALGAFTPVEPCDEQP